MTTASRLATILVALRQALEAGEIEQRLAELEARVTDRVRLQ